MLNSELQTALTCDFWNKQNDSIILYLTRIVSLNSFRTFAYATFHSLESSTNIFSFFYKAKCKLTFSCFICSSRLLNNSVANSYNLKFIICKGFIKVLYSISRWFLCLILSNCSSVICVSFDFDLLHSDNFRVNLSPNRFSNMNWLSSILSLIPKNTIFLKWNFSFMGLLL